MATKGGPKVVTDNLQLYLDGDNSKGYNSQYNQLTDLSANYYQYNVKNIALPLTEWTSVKRSVISEITDGSIEPPFDSARVWSSTINTSLYANTLHRMWSNGNVNGVIGNLGMGYYHYYMWVRGDSNNSSNCSIQIDISDGKGTPSTLIGTNEQWQLLSVWDNTTSNYNSSKFFDYSLTGQDGDTFYISGISVVRFDVSLESELTPIYGFPGYINYNEFKKLKPAANLFNGLTLDINNTLSFDGTNDYAETDINGFSAANDCTLSVWAKSDNYVVGAGILSNKSYFSLGQGIAIGNISSPRRVMLIVNTDVETKSIHFITEETYDWTLFTAVKSGNTINLYTNGLFYRSFSFLGNITSDSSKISIGRYLGYSSYWSGDLALAKVYDKALTAEEVFQNYETTKFRFQ